MENFLACTVLYIVAVSFVLTSKPSKKQSKREQRATKLITDAPIIDISCIFEEEDKEMSRQKEVSSLDLTRLRAMSVRELRELAKQQKITRTYKLSKAELVKKLIAT